MSKRDELMKGLDNVRESMGQAGGAVRGAPPVGPRAVPAHLVGVVRSKDLSRIALDRIDRDPTQPREEFDAEPLARLAESLKARGQLLEMASKDAAIGMLRPNGLDDEPQYQLDIDWEKASALGLSISSISNSLQAGWGSSYINQFLDRGRVKKVFIQGAPDSRMLPQDLDRWYVRNASGQMTPFSAFSSAHWTYGSPKLERYNGSSSLEFLGGPAPGKSSGDALTAMEQLAAKLPKGIGYEWTGLSYEERLSGTQAPALYAISLTIVFLCLAALYESWSIPVAVMLVVPLGIIGTVLATMLRGLSNDVFF